MNKGNRLNALLVEILIAVLFFSLSATVILQCFLTTRELEHQTTLSDKALYSIQNLAEMLYMAENWEQTLSDSGLTEGDGKWTADLGGWQLEVMVHEESHSSGVLKTANISARTDGKTFIELPSTRYIPREVSQ